MQYERLFGVPIAGHNGKYNASGVGVRVLHHVHNIGHNIGLIRCRRLYEIISQFRLS